MKAPHQIEQPYSPSDSIWTHFRIGQTGILLLKVNILVNTIEGDGISLNTRYECHSSTDGSIQGKSLQLIINHDIHWQVKVSS